MLRGSGYDAVGIDPVAPEGDGYRRIEVERSELPLRLDAVIACTSLHHVADPSEVLDKVAGALDPHGLIVVVEWDWENFDEATGRWCLERLDPVERDSWLAHLRDEWATSGQGWDEYLHAFAERHGLHGARRIVDELDHRFDRLSYRRAPYFFPDLSETTEADELEAISAGRIQAARIEYVGRRR
jgi:SAM-dependent methyltransferase